MSNDYSVGKKLVKLWENKELVDLKLVLNDNQVYNVHKLVLSASSPVFKAMFNNPNWSCDIVELTEDPMCHAIFDGFLRYLYLSQVKHDLNNVLPYLILADKYEVHDLLKLCIDYINIHAGNALKNGQIISWYDYCHASSQINSSILFNIISWNFSYILTKDYFTQIPLHILNNFLMHKEIVMVNENQLKDGLEKWVEMNKDMYNSCKIGELYLKIRTPYLPMKTLADIYSSNDTKYNLQIATKFHTFNAKERCLIKLNKEESLLCSPRIYISELWSTTFIIPNYSKFPKYGVRTEIFSTLASTSRADNRIYWEWILDFYPKGIKYDKCIYISMNRTYEVPGVTINSVQARLTAINNNFDSANHCGKYTATALRERAGLPFQRISSANSSTLSSRNVDVFFLFHTQAPSGNLFPKNSLYSTKSPKLSTVLNSPYEWNNAIRRAHTSVFRNRGRQNHTFHDTFNNNEDSVNGFESEWLNDDLDNNQTDYSADGGVGGNSFSSPSTCMEEMRIEWEMRTGLKYLEPNLTYRQLFGPARFSHPSERDCAYIDTEIASNNNNREYISCLVKRENCKFFHDFTKISSGRCPDHDDNIIVNVAKKKKSNIVSDHLYYLTSSTNIESPNNECLCQNMGNEATRISTCSQTSCMKFEDLVPFQCLNYFPQAQNSSLKVPPLLSNKTFYSTNTNNSNNSIIAEHNYDSSHLDDISFDNEQNSSSTSTNYFETSFDSANLGGLITRPNSLRISFTPNNDGIGNYNLQNNYDPSIPPEVRNQRFLDDNFSNIFDRSKHQNPSIPYKEANSSNTQHQTTDVLYLKDRDALKVTVVIIPKI